MRDDDAADLPDPERVYRNYVAQCRRLGVTPTPRERAMAAIRPTHSLPREQRPLRSGGPEPPLQPFRPRRVIVDVMDAKRAYGAIHYKGQA